MWSNSGNMAWSDLYLCICRKAFVQDTTITGLKLRPGRLKKNKNPGPCPISICLFVIE
jgi:hypothetical protein